MMVTPGVRARWPTAAAPGGQGRPDDRATGWAAALYRPDRRPGETPMVLTSGREVRRVDGALRRVRMCFRTAPQVGLRPLRRAARHVWAGPTGWLERITSLGSYIAFTCCNRLCTMGPQRRSPCLVTS